MQTPKLEKGKRREGGVMDGKDSLSRDWCVCVLSGGRDNMHAGLCFGKKKRSCIKYSRRVGSVSVCWTDFNLLENVQEVFSSNRESSLWERCLCLKDYEGFYQEALVGGLGQISGFS